MTFLRFFSPLRAWADLRLFLSRRQPHQLLFATLALAMTGLFVFEIAHDAHYVAEYHPHITYVTQWRADRSEADILAQQKVDTAAKKKSDAEQARADAERRAQFKRVDDALKRYGI